MSDPRITLGVDSASNDGGAVADALDRTRPIVRVDPALSPAGATAAAALLLMLLRRARTAASATATERKR